MSNAASETDDLLWDLLGEELMVAQIPRPSSVPSLADAASWETEALKVCRMIEKKIAREVGTVRPGRN